MDNARRSKPKARVAATLKSLPTGTVTFLFTDIEGSTERWERDSKAMSAAVARHDALLRAAIESHGGYVFKTVGDAFCSVFQDAREALTSALDGQRALAETDFAAVGGLKVRMALHTGFADERDGDYFGSTVNRTARLLDIGHGGQVLVSDVTADLVRDALPKTAALHELGAHRLKDLTAPEHVHQLVASGLTAKFPLLRSLDTLRNNLPQQLTSLIGRDQEVAQIAELLDEHRSITLTGVGGVGKTRLALQAGAELADRFEDGVWFIDLALLADSDLIAGAIAALFGVRESPGQSSLEAIGHALKPKRMLLILDDCEHVIAVAAKVAEALLRTCPQVRILATSREPLHIQGERIVPVSTLSTPESTEGLTVARALEHAAVALFVQRAAASDSRFSLTDANVAGVGEISRRLDGIPLALELAAARVRALGVSHLSEHLAQRFRLLTGGGRTAPARHQTLRAAIDWSYNLLSEAERLLFCRLGIFAGGFDLEAATAVCAAKPIEEFEVVDLLSSLVDKSLVMPDFGHEMRYRLLESTRAYALERMEEEGVRESTCERHCRYFAEIAKKLCDALPTTNLNPWLARIRANLENYRAALEWALGRGRDSALGAELACGLETFWWHGGSEAEGRRWIKAALDHVDEGAYPEVTVRLRRVLARLTARVLYS